MRKNPLCSRSLTCRTGTVDAGGNDIPFTIIESSMYKRRRTAVPSEPSDPRETDATITDSRFVSLGDDPFYRCSVSTGDGDTALILASDGQLELFVSSGVRLRHFSGSVFAILSAIYGLRPAHQSIVFSERELIARPSACRLSSACLLTVTFVRPKQAIKIVDNVSNFLRHLVQWQSVDIQIKFYGDRPRETPP